MPGWQTPTTNAKIYDDLPQRACDYVEYIEKSVGVPTKYIGTDPEREAVIQRVRLRKRMKHPSPFSEGWDVVSKPFRDSKLSVDL